MLKRSRGFTLIELLVVIAIIALLVSILLPSLSSARDLARRVACSTNMRNQATAMAQYASEYSEWIVPWRIRTGVHPDWPDGQFWTSSLVAADYMDAPDMRKVSANDDRSGFRCPMANLNENVGGAWYSGDNHRVTSGFMFYYPFYTDSSNDTTAEPSSGVPVRAWYALNANTWPKHQPVGTVRSMTDYNNLHKMGDIVRASATVLGYEGCLESGPRNFWARIAARHPEYSSDGNHGVTNLSFFDGHVSPYSTSYLRFDCTKGDNGDIKWEPK